MKKIYILIGIYIVALTLSILGYIIDSDPLINSFAYQIVEVFMMSIVVFTIIFLPMLLIRSLFISIKKRFSI